MQEEWRYEEDVKIDGTLSLAEWNLLTKLIFGLEKWEDWKGEVGTILNSLNIELIITKKEKDYE